MDKPYNLRERKQKENQLDESKNKPAKDDSKQQKQQPKQQKRGDDTKKKSNKCFTFCLLAFLLLGLPLVIILIPLLKFDNPIQAHYIKLAEPPKFEGNLKENNRLKSAEYIGKGKILGPETVVFIGDDMYSGLSNGWLARIDKDGNPHKIADFGANPSDKKCAMFASHNASKECGRPLGLRSKAPYIYVVDGYNGLFKVNVDTKEKIHLLKSHEKIPKDDPINFLDDLDVDDDGNIYFTDSSRKRQLHESVELHLEATPDGRVFRYNENTKELEKLMDGIRFSNGIQLTPDKDALLVSEHCHARILKYHLKGSKKGQTEVLINTPGFPDNLRLSEHQTILVALVVVRNPNPFKPSSLELFGEYPKIRTFLGSVLDLSHIAMSAPKYGLVVEYDLNGNILRSWHDPTGERVAMATCPTMHKKKLYIGSFNYDYVAVVDY